MTDESGKDNDDGKGKGIGKDKGKAKTETGTNATPTTGGICDMETSDIYISQTPKHKHRHKHEHKHTHTHTRIKTFEYVPKRTEKERYRAFRDGKTHWKYIRCTVSLGFFCSVNCWLVKFTDTYNHIRQRKHLKYKDMRHMRHGNI